MGQRETKKPAMWMKSVCVCVCVQKKSLLSPDSSSKSFTHIQGCLEIIFCLIILFRNPDGKRKLASTSKLIHCRTSRYHRIG